MVTVVVGAVAVGIFSAVCAIPIGCFLSRKMRKRESTTPHAASEPEYANEELLARRHASRLSHPVELSTPSERESGNVKSQLSRSERGPRIEVRVFLSDDSTVGSTDVDSLGYVSAPASSDFPSGARRRGSGMAVAGAEVKRMSLQHRRSETATYAAPSRSSSLPVTATTPHALSNELESAYQEVQNGDSTVLEISICGRFAEGASAQFVEFKDDMPRSSTPETRRSNSEAVPHLDESVNSITCYRDPPVTRTYGFWRRAPFGRTKSQKIYTATEEIEVVDARDGTCRDWSMSFCDSIPPLVEDAEEILPEEERSYRKDDSRSSSKTAGPSRDDAHMSLWSYWMGNT